MSDSGQYMYTFSGYGLYKSSNFGADWQYIYSGYDILSVAVSGSGQYVYGVSSNFYNSGFAVILYSSSDYGSTWGQKSTIIFGSGNPGNFRLATSSNAKYVAISASYNIIGYGSYEVYISSDYGASLTTHGIASNQSPTVISLSMSSTGQYLVVSIFYEGIYVSLDYGASWQLSNAATNIYSVSMSGNAAVIAAGSIGYVYLGTFPLTSSPIIDPTMNPTPSTVSSPTLLPSLKTEKPLQVFTYRPSTASPTTATPTRPTPSPSSLPTILPTINVQYDWSASFQASDLTSSMFVSISKSGAYIGAVSVSDQGGPIYLSNNGGES